MRKHWSLADMPALTNKQVFITGANTGLGFEAAKAMAAKGAYVTLGCRDSSKGDQACEKILRVVPGAQLAVQPLDLGDLASVRQCAQALRARLPRLDILMNNAGIMTTPLFRTADGFEGQMGTNHLGHFALTGLLMPVIEKTPGARVVTVSSNAHKGVKLHFDNLNFEDESAYTPMRAYQASKLANLLFHYELARRLARARLDCIATAAHPGASVTNLGRHLASHWAYPLASAALKMALNPPRKAAWPQLRAATDPAARNGDYFGPGGPGEWRGKPVPVAAAGQARKEAPAATLWHMSASLTGVHYLEDT
ncbi:MAG: oxidoreductase [Alcanivoracaceae bacterium]|nr:oxidoreductase [Alcanivoracaceae bacterium]